MKKFNLKCLALIIPTFAIQLATAQQQADIIIGEPDIYQDYLILDPEVDSTITHWRVAIYEQVYDTVADRVQSNLVGKQGTSDLDSYIRIDPAHRLERDHLKIIVEGLDGNDAPIVVDEWIESVPDDHISNEPFCGMSCIGKTYAFEVVINERVDLNGQVLSGHTVTFRQENPAWEQGGYMPEYRHLSFNEADVIDENSGTQCADDLTETYCHYGITPPSSGGNLSFFGQYEQDGVKIIKRVGVTTADQLKDKNGNVLTGIVYSIQKHLGKWQDQIEMSDVLANEPAIPCGDFGTSITSMISHANSNLNLNDNLVCNGFGGGANPWGDLPFNVWSDLHDDWVVWDEDIYDILQETINIFNDDFGDNTTGVDWWPSDDVRQIQVINIQKGVGQSNPQQTITLYKDSLFNGAGEPNYNNLSLNKGLYNVLFLFPEGHTFPLILNKTNSETIGFAHTHFLTVDIYPNPITSGNLTVAMEADATIHFDYKILDGQGAQIYSKTGITINKDHSQDLIIPVDNFPSGSLVHVFEMSDGSSVSYTTVKN